MRPDLASLLHERRGHFRYESGHHGRLWLELERLYLKPDAVRPVAAELAAHIRSYEPEIVCGPLIEGAFVALQVAEALKLDFVYAERFANPGSEDLYPVDYRLPSPVRSLVRDRRVAVVNDVVNAGSAVGGTLRDLQSLGAKPVVLATLLSLGDKPQQLADGAGVPLESLAEEPMDLWLPQSCPLCAAGAPLGEPA